MRKSASRASDAASRSLSDSISDPKTSAERTENKGLLTDTAVPESVQEEGSWAILSCNKIARSIHCAFPPPNAIRMSYHDCTMQHAYLTSGSSLSVRMTNFPDQAAHNSPETSLACHDIRPTTSRHPEIPVPLRESSRMMKGCDLLFR